MDLLKSVVGRLLNPRTELGKLSRSAAAVGESSNGGAPAGARGRLRFRDVLFNLPLIMGAVIVLGLFLVVLFGPVWAPKNPYIAGQHIVPHFDFESDEFISPPLSPSSEYPLGTDRWGNDLLSLLMHGARNTLVACAFITMVRVLLGLTLGGIAGWNEGRASDQIIMGLSGVVISVPMLISSMVLIFALDIRKGLPVFIIALSVVGWTEIAQYIRSEFLVLRKMPYIEGAWATGLSGLAIAVRHVLPNILPQLLVISFLEMGAVMMLLGELGFVGVYIGGGSEFAVELDPFTVEIERVVDVPEWGAMLAEGFRWLRSKPFVVFPPAMAFFVAVVGFNALGEGLRRLVEQASINTAFLLHRRMVLVIVGLTLATVFIMNNTGAAPWFAKVAGAFRGDLAYEHVQALAEMEGRGIEQVGGAQAADYIVEKFKAFGLRPGGKRSSYTYPFETQLVQPLAQPALAVIGGDGQVLQAFRHQLDFGFVIEGHGGSGEVEAPLTFVGFHRRLGEYEWEDFKGLDLRDRIVLLLQEDAPEDFAAEALIRGARGLLSIVGDGRDDVLSQVQLAAPDQTYLRQPNMPIFYIRRSVADAILEQNGLTVSDLLARETDVAQSGPGWFTLDLGATVRMSVALSEPRPVEIPCVLGFRQGSDFNLAGEVVVLLAHYNGLGKALDGTVFPAANHNASGVGMLLEVARLWQEQNLDTRRSVLFVAWGGAGLQDPGVKDFLKVTYHYRHLSELRTADSLAPAMLIQPDAVGAGGDSLFIHPRSDKRLAELLEETAAEAGIATVSGPSSSESNNDVVMPEIPWLYFSWSDAQVSPDRDSIERIESEKLQSLGESLALALTRIVRETDY